MDEEGHPAAAEPASRKILVGVLLAFLRLGFIGFGGGMAVVALMEHDLIRKRRLLDPDEFLHGLALGQVLGPFAVNTALFVGNLSEYGHIVDYIGYRNECPAMAVPGWHRTTTPLLSVPTAYPRQCRPQNDFSCLWAMMSRLGDTENLMISVGNVLPTRIRITSIYSAFLDV